MKEKLYLTEEQHREFRDKFDKVEWEIKERLQGWFGEGEPEEDDFCWRWTTDGAEILFENTEKFALYFYPR